MASITEIAEEYSEVTLKEVYELYHKEIDEFNQDLSGKMTEIKFLINKLVENMRYYEYWLKVLPQIDMKSIDRQMMKAEMQKELIYKDFFKLQNLINSFLYQKVIMTYVHVDPLTGKREIQLFDNDTESLMTTEVNRFGKNYAKLSYELGNRYVQLKNSLPDEANEGLQETAKQVTLRYEKYKGRILWKLQDELVGYKLNNRGPINEAFVDFYIKEVELKNSLNDNIDIFMRSTNPQGVIQADNANGFLIGDVSLGGLQFAVKGAYGSPQNFTLIINWLEKIQAENFSEQSLIEFIQRFKDEEQQRATKLVKPMLKRSISNMVRYHGEEKLLAPLEKDINGNITIQFN